MVRTPECRVEVDPTGKKAGRGAYLCSDPACWEQGLKRDRIARALRIRLLPEDAEQLSAYAASLPHEPA